MLAPLRLFYAEIGSIDEDARSELLAPDDFERVEGLTPARRRGEFLASRALLRHALQCCTGRSAKAQRIGVRRNGKPECVEGPPFSLTHSGGLSACAVAPAGEIGIDLEFPRRHRRVDEIAREYFSAWENDWLRTQPPNRFYMLWVLKEAYLKALGDGISGGLQTLECRVLPPTIELRMGRGLPSPALALYSVADGFLGVATTACGVSDMRLESWGGAARHDIRLIATSA